MASLIPASFTVDLNTKVAKKFKEAYVKVLREEFPLDYAAVFEEVYDDLLVRPYESSMHEKDHTRPSFIRTEVVNYVESEVSKSINKADFAGNRLVVKVLLDELDVKPKGDETWGVRLFYFYLVGTPGKFVTLGEREYKKIGSSKTRWGRFGTVHMIAYKKYEKMYNNNKGSTKGWPSPSSVIHPFSGVAPVRIFEEASKRFNESGYIEQYIKEAKRLF